MPAIIFTQNNTKPIFNCSTIDAYLYDVSFKKYDKEYKYSETKCTVQWYDGHCGWISIDNEVFDNRFIPEDLLIQIVEFMSDQNNYDYCILHHH